MAVKRTTADKWFSKCVRIRANWTCEYCNIDYSHDKGYLHCSHYISRSYKAVRYHPDNAFAHCMQCHEKLGGGRWGGGNHAEFAHHYDEVHGSYKREVMRRLSKYPFPHHNKHLSDISNFYREAYQEMEQMRADGYDGPVEFEFYDGSQEMLQLISDTYEDCLQLWEIECNAEDS